MNLGSLVCVTALLSAFALASCVSPNDAQSASTSAAALSSDAGRLAVALADADAAFARNDRERLAEALRRVDALGGKPLDASSPELARWRQATVQDPPMRGRPLGPGFRSGELSPGSSEQLEQVFLSGKRASVALTAPNNARLKLEIQDRHDAAVCGREGNPSQCQWVPVFTDRYRIRVANPGTAPVKYFLVVD
jgi:hypothetical protein